MFVDKPVESTKKASGGCYRISGHETNWDTRATTGVPTITGASILATKQGGVKNGGEKARIGLADQPDKMTAADL